MGSVEHLEPWLTKRELAGHFGFSVSWLELRMQEGAPRATIAGRVKFRVSEVEPWLEAQGHIKREGAA